MKHTVGEKEWSPFFRSQPATCVDGKMRSVAFHSRLPMQSHDLETAGRRCTSGAEFQRLCSRMATAIYLRKRKAEIFPFSRQENLPVACFCSRYLLFNSLSGFNIFYMTCGVAACLECGCHRDSSRDHCLQVEMQPACSPANAEAATNSCSSPVWTKSKSMIVAMRSLEFCTAN